MAKTVYFVRHGATLSNTANVYQERNTKLSEAGHADAEVVAERLAHVPVDMIVSSPLLRAQETAAHIAKRIGVPVQVCETAHERRVPTELIGKGKESPEGIAFREARRSLLQQTDNLPAGFENFAMVSARINETIQYLQNLSHENIVLVSHDSFMRLITAILLQGKEVDFDTSITVMDSLQSLANGGITKWQVKGDVWELQIYNDHAHFAE